MEVLTREKFVSSEQKVFHLPPGLTLDELMTAAEWSADLRPWTVITVDGQEVPAEYWRRVRPKVGRQVLIAMRPSGGGSGGGSGKQIAMAVAALQAAHTEPEDVTA